MEAQPKCPPLARLTENGDNRIWWSLDTHYPLEVVMGKDFFRDVGRHGLRRLDVIEACCDIDLMTPTFASLIVTDSKAGRITVAIKPGSEYTIEVAARSPFEVLGILPGANAIAIEAAYKAKAKLTHPDAPGGSKAKFEAIKKAFDDCLIIASNQAA